MENEKKSIVPFAATLSNSVALNNYIGNGMPFLPPALLDKLDALDGDVDLYGDKRRNDKT